MCRKLLRIFVCMLLVSSMLAVPSFAESAVITGSKVNLRPGPGTEYAPITAIERNTAVDIVNRYNDAWYEVNYNGILGFVSSAYLDTAGSSSGGITVIQLPQSNAPSAAPAGNTVSAAPSGNAGDTIAYINAMYVRFRSGPGSGYSIVGEYNKGKEIRVVTAVGDWVAGYIDGTPGYVHKDYVSKSLAGSVSSSVGNSSIGGSSAGQSNIVVLSPTSSPADNSSLPRPNEELVVLSPKTTTVPEPEKPVVVLPQPNPTAASPVPTVNADGVKGYIVGTYVRFRTGPGTNYSIIGTYNTGKEFTAYANCGDGWLFGVIDGREGYVHGSYVYIVGGTSGAQSSVQTDKPAQDIQIVASAPSQSEAASGKTGYIIGNNVRFRAGASMTSQILGELFYGNQVTILGINGEWTKIIADNSVGFVYSTYVKEGSYGAGAGTGAAASAGSTGTVMSANVSGQDIVNFAGQLLGAGYCWGGTSPETGFDCSGFVYYVFQHFGITVSRVASDQASNGVHVDPGNLRPGDILCFYSGSSYIGHSGIYIGSNKFIHSSNSTTGVIISDLSGYYASRGFEARRIVAK